MPTFQPGVSGDDGGDWNSANFQNAGSNLPIGDDSGAGYRIFVRFPNVTVPQGATITACALQLDALFADSAATVNVNVYFQNADNAAAPTSTAELDTAFTGATSAVAWSGIPAWSADESGADTTTPDLSSILQTVINRGGWSSGNALVLLISNNGSSSGANRRPKSFDWESGLPTLTVTFTETGGAVSRSSLMLLGVGR